MNVKGDYPRALNGPKVYTETEIIDGRGKEIRYALPVRTAAVIVVAS